MRACHGSVGRAAIHHSLDLLVRAHRRPLLSIDVSASRAISDLEVLLAPSGHKQIAQLLIVDLKHAARDLHLQRVALDALFLLEDLLACRHSEKLWKGGQ